MQRSYKLPNAQAGVTIIELMIAVAIVGILAGLAVYMFGKSADKARASEVRVMMTEFKTRQEAFYVENSNYLSTGANDSDLWPAVIGGSNKSPVDMANADARAAAWRQLRMKPPESSLYCSYVSMAGDAGAGAGGRAANPATFNFNNPVPNQDWFYTLAECDWDGDPGTNSLYMTRFDRDGMVVINEGK